MLRIAVCIRDSQTAQELFDRAREVLREHKIRCELSCHKDLAKVAENMTQDRNFYDIFFLDARDADCLAFAKRLRSVNLTASVIFLDRDLEQIHDLLRWRPTALMLPGSIPQRVSPVLLLCCSEQLRCTRHFTVKNRDGIVRIPFDEITFVESRQRLAIMHTKNKTVEFYAKLSEVMQQLPQDDFLHCHQSYIVNLRTVARLDRANRCFILNGGTPVEISKSNYSDTVARYSAFLEG